jgi:hypothetical protein
LTDPARRSWLSHGPFTIAAIVVAASLLFTLAVSLLLAISSNSDDGPSGPRAVIIDQLAHTDANPDFAKDATSVLESAGYRVDYYPSAAITVEFYRELPSRGYSFVLLRSHSTNFLTRPDENNPGETVVDKSVMLFTTEPYTVFAHGDEQRDRQIAVGSYPDHPDAGRYFLIQPEFVASRMHGHFKDATVVLMGCGGLSTPDLAEAFKGRGAKEFISWDASVTAAHTDEATRSLLGHLVRDGLTPDEAVAKTMEDVGPDPAFGARLVTFR